MKEVYWLEDVRKRKEDGGGLDFFAPRNPIGRDCDAKGEVNRCDGRRHEWHHSITLSPITLSQFTNTSRKEYLKTFNHQSIERTAFVTDIIH